MVTKAWRLGNRELLLNGYRIAVNGELLLNGYRIAVCEHEKIVQMDSGDGCILMYLMPLNCTLKKSLKCTSRQILCDSTSVRYLKLSDS